MVQHGNIMQMLWVQISPSNIYWIVYVLGFDVKEMNPIYCESACWRLDLNDIYVVLSKHLSF